MKSLNDINTEVLEGKLLLAAIAIITTVPGFTNKTPDEVLAQVVITSNHMYPEPKQISMEPDWIKER